MARGGKGALAKERARPRVKSKVGNETCQKTKGPIRGGGWLPLPRKKRWQKGKWGYLLWADSPLKRPEKDSECDP